MSAPGRRYGSYFKHYPPSGPLSPRYEHAALFLAGSAQLPSVGAARQGPARPGEPLSPRLLEGEPLMSPRSKPSPSTSGTPSSTTIPTSPSARQGLRSKKAERRHLLWQALDRQGPIERGRVKLAYDVADAAFNKVWHDQHVTWPIGERLQVALKGLGRTLPADAFAEVVARMRRWRWTIRPDLIPGMAEALAEAPWPLPDLHRLRRHRLARPLPAPAARELRPRPPFRRLRFLRRGRLFEAAPLHVRIGRPPDGRRPGRDGPYRRPRP